MNEQFDKELKEGYQGYSVGFLRAYDPIVTRLSNTFVWKCSAATLLRQYTGNLSSSHLEIGPGTGWYLAHSEPPAPAAAVTLMDMNETVLRYASTRAARKGHNVTTHVGDVLAPLDESLGTFASVGCNLVLHCVPGKGWADKGVAFRHIADRLDDDGVLFGATVLAHGVKHNWLTRKLIALYNKKGLFHNTGDDADGLKAALEEAFTEVDFRIIGTNGVFVARRPRRADESAHEQS